MAQSTDRKSQKILYSMGEVCEMFDVNASLIRFWEKKFDVLKPKKNAKGNRLFSVDDIENLKIIYHLVKERGMTLHGAEQFIKDNKLKLRKDVGVIEILQRVRATLVDMRTEIDAQAKKQENQIIIQSEQTTPQIEEQTEISKLPYYEQTLFTF